MSFLDATGLGTFWNKLKSTFQGPVSEVYKDALTPENEWPDSKFIYREGTNISSVTPNISGNTNIINLWILLRIRNSSVNNTFENVSVTRSGGVVTFSAKVLTRDPEDGKCEVIFLANAYAQPESTKMYTIGCTLESASSGTYIRTSVYNGSTSTLININAENAGDKALTIRNSSSSSDSVPFISVSFAGVAIGSTFTVSFKEPFVYEGEFLNPPYKVNALTRKNNYFFPWLYLTRLFAYQKSVTYNTVGWKRIFISKRSVSINQNQKHFKAKIFIGKSFTTNSYETHEIEFGYSGGAGNTGTFRGYLNIKSFANKTAFSITKARIGLSSTENSRPVLDIYYSLNSEDAFGIVLKDYEEIHTHLEFCGLQNNGLVATTAFLPPIDFVVADNTSITETLTYSKEVTTTNMYETL